MEVYPNNSESNGEETGKQNGKWDYVVLLKRGRVSQNRGFPVQGSMLGSPLFGKPPHEVRRVQVPWASCCCSQSHRSPAKTDVPIQWATLSLF